MNIKRTPLTIAQKKYADNLKKIWNEKKQEWRQKGKKLTQERAAEQLGFETQGAISQYLNGKVALNDSTILKFSKFLGCNPGEIKPELDSFINKDIKFLSCLCGSEPRSGRGSGSFGFLSCLCGSEHTALFLEDRSNFLSCLCGSEPFVLTLGFFVSFLSCLCGSEPEPTT